MYTPLFSIVIVNFNHGKYLRETIESILCQDCQDFELIIIDGGSKDNSVDIIKSFENNLAYWISEPDRGQSDAFNKGFAQANGEFLFWVNADDFLLPHSLSTAKKVILKNPNSKWFSANTIYFDQEAKIIKCAYGHNWNSYFFKKTPIYVYGPTSIFHKSIWEKVGGFDLDLNYSMDTDLWYKFYEVGIRFKKIPHYFWGFRIHEDSKTSHELVGKPDQKFNLEKKNLLNKHNRKKNTFFTQCQLFMFKVLNGCYLKSIIDTYKFKGKSYKDYRLKNNN